jgi:hypothetical protein
MVAGGVLFVLWEGSSLIGSDCPSTPGGWRPVRLQEQGLRVDIDSVDSVATCGFRSAARMWNQTLRCVNERIWRLLQIGDW